MSDETGEQKLRRLALDVLATSNQVAKEELARLVQKLIQPTLARHMKGLRQEDRDDVFRETVMALLNSLNKIADKKSGVAFVRAIAINKIRLHFRDRRPANPADMTDSLENVVDPSIDTLKHVAGQQWLAVLLSRLPVLERQVVILLYRGFGRGEIMQELGITLHRYRNAIKKIRDEGDDLD